MQDGLLNYQPCFWYARTHARTHTHTCHVWFLWFLFSLSFAGLILLLQRWCSGAAGHSGWASSFAHVHFPVGLLPVCSTKVKDSPTTLPLLLSPYVCIYPWWLLCFLLIDVQFNGASASSSDSYCIWSLASAIGHSTPQQTHTGTIQLIQSRCILHYVAVGFPASFFPLTGTC